MTERRPKKSRKPYTVDVFAKMVLETLGATPCSIQKGAEYFLVSSKKLRSKMQAAVLRRAPAFERKPVVLFNGARRGDAAAYGDEYCAL